ncbi:MAG: hypothetical protein Q605_AUC00446G0001, partial [Actinomyces urogenitalis DORA_12]
MGKITCLLPFSGVVVPVVYLQRGQARLSHACEGLVGHETTLPPTSPRVRRHRHASRSPDELTGTHRIQRPVTDVVGAAGGQRPGE